MERLEQHPGYRWARLLQQTEGRALMDRHGAHSLGIGWSDPERVPSEPALVFYIDDGAPDGEPVPPAFVVNDRSGRSIEVPTRVVDSPPASSE